MLVSESLYQLLRIMNGRLDDLEDQMDTLHGLYRNLYEQVENMKKLGNFEVCDLYIKDFPEVKAPTPEERDLLLHDCLPLKKDHDLFGGTE